MRLSNLVVFCSVLTLASSTAIPRRSLRKAKAVRARRDDWSDVTFDGARPSTTVETDSYAPTATGSGPPAISSLLADYDDDEDDVDDALLYAQEELYLLAPGYGIEYDCVGDTVTLYFDADLPINGSLTEFAEFFEAGVVLIQNNWPSYCGDISDWTLYGQTDEDLVFDNHDEELAYYQAILDPDVQYAVVVLSELLDIDTANRSITYDAYADDFRSIIGALDTPPSSFDYFTPGPIGNASDTDDFYDPDTRKRGLPEKSLTKRGGLTDVAKIVKLLPGFTKSMGDVVKTTTTVVNQGVRLIKVAELARGTQNPFNQEDVTLELDLSKLPQLPGWGGYKYQLYQFYFEGKFWAEIWRTFDPDWREPPPKPNTPDPTSGTTIPPTTTMMPTTAAPSTTLSAGNPICSWRGDKEPLDKPGGWRELFKIDAGELIARRDLPFPLNVMNIHSMVEMPHKVESALASANSILTHLTLLKSTTATTMGTVQITSAVTAPVPANPTTTASPAQKRGYLVEKAALEEAEPEEENDNYLNSLIARQEAPQSNFDLNCDLEILDWDIVLRTGDTSVNVIPPGVKFEKFALSNRASIRVQCEKPLLQVKEVYRKRLVAVPIGGCSSAPLINTGPMVNLLEVDAFFILWLNVDFFTGGNGSVQIDYSYQWDPIDMAFELITPQNEDGQFQFNSTKLGIGPPSTNGFHFDYVRATSTFPDLQLGLELSPALQIDVATPIVNYTRGFMLGPALTMSSNATFSVGSGVKPSDNFNVIGGVPVAQNPGILDGTTVNPFTGLNVGILWTDYTYQKLVGPLSSILTLPGFKARISWLYGPIRIWTRTFDYSDVMGLLSL